MPVKPRPSKPRKSARIRTRKSSKPEIVVKLGYWFLADRKGVPTALPLLTLLCNKEGYLSLARIFRDRARSYEKSMSRPFQDQHDHLHFVVAEGEGNDVNAALSDRLEIRLVSLYPSTRRTTLAGYGATPKHAAHSDAPTMLAALARRAHKRQVSHRKLYAAVDADMRNGVPSGRRRKRVYWSDEAQPLIGSMSQWFVIRNPRRKKKKRAAGAAVTPKTRSR